MRKRLLVLLMAAFMVVMSAAPAMAARIRDPQPIRPPGIENNKGNGGLNNAHVLEQAPDIQTGAGNKFDRGSPQNGK
jgi:hypothetical protein